MVDGETVNNAAMRISLSMLRKGEHPTDVQEFLVNEVMARVGPSLGWTREKEMGSTPARAS